MMVSTIFDNNGGLGLSDFEGEGAPFMFANAFGPVLTVEIDEDGDQMIDDTLTFERVEEDGIVGAWRAIENENDLLAVVFFGDGTYVHAEVDFDDQLDPSGMEWGEYSRSTDNGQTVASQSFDNNGGTGLNDFSDQVQPPYLSVNTDEGGLLTVEIDEDGIEGADETIYFVPATETMVPF